MSRNTRWMTADEALAHVDSGMSVCFPHLSAEPNALTAALWKRAEALSGITVISGMLLSGYGFLTGPMASKIRFKTWFMPGTLLRKSTGDVNAEYLPFTWAQCARFLNETVMDVGLVPISPADADGYHSLGLNCTVSRALIANSRYLVGQVNANVPHTPGDARVHSSEFDALVDATEPLIEYPARPTDAVDGAIGRNIAPLVPDGSTLSFGVGGLPEAVAAALIAKGARGLKFINTFTDAVMQLIKAGCADANLPSAFCGEIFGTNDLYRWVDGNPALSLTNALETHTPESFVRRKTVVSVNSALEIDLLGQVNAETIGGKQAGAMGGLVDFAAGGQVEGGRFILGIRSQTNSGKPRIVSRLDANLVSVSRTFVETVVTEFGVADLHNKSVNERAVALAGIAHPDDRDALMQEAAKLR
jgi:4-hydroxybutyrate CoA-transferase